MYSIYKKEILSFFNSLIAYIVIGIFLTVIGLYMWVIPDTVFDLAVADMSLLFLVSPYVFLFLIPAITMRSFSEEKKSGTLELLLTRPITEWQLVIGKTLAALTIVVIALIPTLVYFYTIYQLGNPIGNIDAAGVVGAYIGLILLAAVLTAVGTFASSLTDNQIISFISALFFGWVLLEGIGYLGQLIGGDLGLMIGGFGLSYHYAALSKGVLDVYNLVFLLSGVALFMSATRLVIQSRKW